MTIKILMVVLILSLSLYSVKPVNIVTEVIIQPILVQPVILRIQSQGLRQKAIILYKCTLVCQVAGYGV